MTEPPDVSVERRGAVAVIWFDRPGRLNAFRDRTFDELHRALDAAAADRSVEGVVLTGRGRAFCAGEDLEEMDEATSRGFTVRQARTLLERLQDLTRKVAGFPTPVVAAVNGPAVGLGAELPRACGERLASPDAYFWFPEARRGMLQTNGCFHYLPRIVGSGRAAEWLLAVRRIPAAEAERAGLVTAVVPPEALVERAVAVAGAIAAAGQDIVSRSARSPREPISSKP